MKKISVYISALCLVFASCDIDREPYTAMSSEKIKSAPDASLDGILNGAYAQLKPWSDVMHRAGEYAGDNIMIRGASTDAFYEFISYNRTPNNYRLQGFWDNSYKAIAQTSNIINLVKEGQSEEVDSKLGECYFLRGLMYFYLVRAYGRPYYQNPEINLGVPIVNGTPEDVKTATLPDRATVKKTYEQIISDLKKAEELLKTNRGPAYASKAAAQAILSRVYLYMSGTYSNPNTQNAQLAIEYADKVINNPDYALLDTGKFKVYNTILPENNPESIFVVKRVASEFSGYDHYYGVGGMYANIGGMGWGEMYASAKYIDLLNETGVNDWVNHKYSDVRANFIEPQYRKDVEKNKVFRFIVDKYNKENIQIGYTYIQAPVDYDYSLNKPIVNDGKIEITVHEQGKETKYKITPSTEKEGLYTVTYKDGKQYNGVIDNLMKLNRVYPMFYIVKASREGEESHLHSPVITRLGEVYLNRAEAYAKLGNYGKALLDLNKIRTRSINNGAYQNLDVSNAAERIDKERQLELAYQAERSYDVFRNGGSLERKYPGPHNALEVVKPTDYRVIYFIPQDAINAYPGTLTQNPTSN
ncbi:RagB/SusD family nutrient uptake outer membrane protein [Ornithobacterium rhinotracheale]|uniref:RagB/SusD family nutrient uptake outer membrane protein n=1 Tax=Ornithobacterium rhinotracheale TaxID=28251 RepID=A0A410JRR6_ORNRH|nr:RagB/SusD family nutrient uptake outer membrane protein [Ornithobacterium rhinotracheale]QAR30853.1 RagB/SusD family nutrient uptake outer membrane protein [Ornithobacterium rhinotracheale]